MTVTRRAFVATLGGSALLGAACTRSDAPGPLLRAPETSGAPAPPPRNASFPLRIAPGDRHFVDATGRPFFVLGDSPWSLAVQLTRAQVERYLDDRARRGFTAIMFETIEHYFSSQTPPWRNAAGDVPFADDAADRTSVARYWEHVDFVIRAANDRGLVCFLHPAYLGYQGGEEGWTAEVLASSDAALAAYGEWLGRRYRGRGIVWCLGGDYSGERHPGLVEKQWHVARGILRGDAAALLTGHAARGVAARGVWGGMPGFAIDTFYTAGLEYPDALAALGDPARRPFLHIEGHYENHLGTASDCRREAYVSLLCGACGHFYGNAPLWGFGEPHSNGGRGAEHALATALDTPGARQMTHLAELVRACRWWTLEPDVTAQWLASSPGEGRLRVCAAASGDASLALVWTPGVKFALHAARAHGMRARWYDPVTGDYSAATPELAEERAWFTPAADAVLVLDREAARG